MRSSAALRGPSFPIHRLRSVVRGPVTISFYVSVGAFIHAPAKRQAQTQEVYRVQNPIKS